MVNMELPHDPATLFLGYTEEKWNVSPQKNLQKDVYGNIIHNRQTMETIRGSSADEWKNKM